MSVLLALLLSGAGSARIESVGLATVDSRPAVTLQWSGAVRRVAIDRDTDGARISLEGAALGGTFSGASRLEWSWANLASALSTPAGASPGGVRIESGAEAVTLYVHLAPGAELDLRRDRTQLVVVMPRAGLPTSGPQMAASTPPPVREPDPQPTPAKTAVVGTPTPAPNAPAPSLPAPVPSQPIPTAVAAPVGELRVASLDPARLARSLFPVSAATVEPGGGVDRGRSQPASLEGAPDDVAYRKLFPAPAAAESVAGEPANPADDRGREPGLSLGFLTIKPALSIGYVSADVAVRSPEPAHDHFLQVRPTLTFETSLLDGRLVLDYQPVLRGFGSFEPVQSNSHLLGASLDLPLGTRAELRLTDRFATGVLETTEVDPGQEYFFDLGRFTRNAAGARARLELRSRVDLELASGLNRVRFDEPSGFFDYEARMLSAGLGIDLTPTLRGAMSYVYDWVPSPAQRPEAESQAHSAQLSLSGDLLPLLRGQLAVALRDQTSPNAPEGGQRFRGLTLAGTLTRELGKSSSLGLLLDRSTPVSGFEANGFYVTTSAQASLTAPLPLGLALNSGAGYHWNDYRTPAAKLGRPRQDRIFGWYFGLRRPLSRWATLAATYRKDRRNSNLDEFDSVMEGLVLQLDVNFFPGR